MPITASLFIVNPREIKPWYVMPTAQPFSVFIEGKGFSQIIEAFYTSCKKLSNSFTCKEFSTEILNQIIFFII